jgi:hypothetical protein
MAPGLGGIMEADALGTAAPIAPIAARGFIEAYISLFKDMII